MSDLDKALSDFKNDKLRDHAGYVDEIFKKNLRVNCKLFMAWTESQGTEYLNFELRTRLL